MKILKFKGKMPLHKKLLIAFSILLCIFIICVIMVYVFNEEARDWINIYILRKELTEDDIATINLEVDKSQSIFAFDRYIGILYNGKLDLYNSYASKEAELDISISNPIFESNNEYLCIAENKGQRIYLISNEKVLWDNKIEGNIEKVNVSKNGMISVIVTGTSYKSVIITFDKTGKELFKIYLASTIATDIDMSVDGKYLAVAEVNTSGVLIECDIEVIDVEQASKGNSDSAVIYKHSADANDMLINIKYQEKGQLVCIYDDSIHMIYNDKDQILTEFKSNTKIADINLKSFTVRTEEISTGPFSAKTDIILKNIITGAENTYSVDSSVKEIVCCNQTVAVNIGTEIHFINLNGWLEKKYKSNQEAKEIILGTSVAGIVYRDRIKVLTF